MGLKMRFPKGVDISIGKSKVSIPTDTQLKTLNLRVGKLQADLYELKKRVQRLEKK